ncbi:uncharacterized protein METZ01_LOCUS163994, partial [marine metagenome]
IKVITYFIQSPFLKTHFSVLFIIVFSIKFSFFI